MSGAQPLAALVSRQLQPLPNGGQYLLAFSGGMDSSVLFDLMVAAGLGFKALHVHHGLLPDADRWAEHCRAVCTRHAIPFEEIRVQVVMEGQGVEAAARHARYQALATRLGPADVLLTAQHCNDQAETLLIQLLRGAGPIGLSGMPAETTCGRGRLMRPLLAAERREIQAYAEARGLQWIEDPSNRDPVLDRAWLRTQVMPLLSTRWPALVPVLARNAEAQAEAAAVLYERALADGAGAERLSVRALNTLSAARRRNLLRFWLGEHGLRSPGREALLRVEREVLAARPDAAPCLRWPEGEIRRYRDALYAMAPLPQPEAFSEDWGLSGSLKLPCGQLSVRRVQGTGLRAVDGPVRVAYISGGERIKPVGHTHHRTLKQLFQQAGVPPWVRERLPLIWSGEQLVAVADRWIAEGWQAPQQGMGSRLRWENAPIGWDIGSED